MGRLCTLGVLVLALLLVQSLGTWHAVVHPSHVHVHHADAHAERTTFAEHLLAHRHEKDDPENEGFFERLFSNHHEDSDCRVFDQLSHGDVLIGLPLQALPLLVFPVLLLYMSGLATAHWHALFQARGPPLVR